MYSVSVPIFARRGRTYVLLRLIADLLEITFGVQFRCSTRDHCGIRIKCKRGMDQIHPAGSRPQDLILHCEIKCKRGRGVQIQSVGLFSFVFSDFFPTKEATMHGLGWEVPNSCIIGFNSFTLSPALLDLRPLPEQLTESSRSRPRSKNPIVH